MDTGCDGPVGKSALTASGKLDPSVRHDLAVLILWDYIVAQAEAKYGPSGLGMVRFEDLIPAGTKYGTAENGAADLTYRDGNTLWVWEVKQAMTIPWLYYRPPAEAYGGWDLQNCIYKMKKNPAYGQYDIRPGYNIDGPLVGPGAKPGEFLELNDSSLWPNGCREAVAAYRAARRGQGKDRPPVSEVPEAVREVRHMRRDWFRHRVFRPAVEAAGLERRVRVHDLRHASASWALAGGATVQQVREHLGHVSLRAVERYLHSLPGADNGAAGAIARVKETGTLYPVITPSYTPAPPAMDTAAAGTPTPVPGAVPDEIHGAATPVTGRPAREPERHKADVEYPAPEAEPAGGEELRVDAPAAAAELPPSVDARSAPHRRVGHWVPPAREEEEAWKGAASGCGRWASSPKR